MRPMKTAFRVSLYVQQSCICEYVSDGFKTNVVQQGTFELPTLPC